jgi:hypothetical protein
MPRPARAALRLLAEQRALSALLALLDLLPLAVRAFAAFTSAEP